MESLVAQLRLGNCNGIDTPVLKVDVEDHLEQMGPSEASRYRRGAAKLNYLSQDRVDIAFVSKEISRNMSSPKVGDDAMLKRVVRYLQQFSIGGGVPMARRLRGSDRVYGLGSGRVCAHP